MAELLKTLVQTGAEGLQMANVKEEQKSESCYDYELRQRGEQENIQDEDQAVEQEPRVVSPCLEAVLSVHPLV